MGRRLQARAVAASPPAASALALLAGVALSCALMALLVDASRQALVETARIVTPIGVAWLLAAHLAARARRSGSLRLHYAMAAAGTVLVALAAVLWMAHQMFVLRHDAAMLVAFVAFAALVGTRSAALLADRTAAEVERVRAGLDAIAAGDLPRRVEPAGPRELQALAASANAMAASLEHAQAELATAERARRELVAAVSHDLRTPLATLRLLAEAVDDGVLNDADEVRRAMRQVGTQVRSLGALVDDLFELARIDAGDITWSLSPIAVPGLIDETLEAFAPQARQKGLTLRDAVDPAPLAPVLGNPEKLQRVLYNLVQNAVRHTPADGTVTLRASPADGFVLIEVADDGEGLAPATVENAFDPFWRGGEAGARRGDGAGLGLAICRAIVEAHGGRIWIEPSGTPGTRVRFTVPAA